MPFNYCEEKSRRAVKEACRGVPFHHLSRNPLPVPPSMSMQSMVAELVVVAAAVFSSVMAQQHAPLSLGLLSKAALSHSDVFGQRVVRIDAGNLLKNSIVHLAWHLDPNPLFSATQNYFL